MLAVATAPASAQLLADASDPLNELGAHVARRALECRSHLGLEDRAQTPVERAGVHLRDHARRDPAYRRAQHPRGVAPRAQPAGHAAHLERLFQRRARLRRARPTCRTSPTRSSSSSMGAASIRRCSPASSTTCRTCSWTTSSASRCISGPGATLWGANAMNGVINIITRKASDTQGALVRARRRRRKSRRSARVTAAARRRRRVPRLREVVRSRRQRISPMAPAREDDWSKLQAGFRIGCGVGRQLASPCRATTRRARSELRGRERRRRSRAPTCSAAGNTAGERVSHASAGVLRPRAIASVRRAASPSTSTLYDFELQQSASVGARHQPDLGSWAGAPTTTTPSTTSWRSSPITARSSSPTCSCRTPSR